MTEVDLTYLKHLIKETNDKRKGFRFFLPDEEDAQISYIPSKLKIYFPGQIDSLHFRYELEKYNTRERPTLRKNTQNYHRIVRKDGRIIRIDAFVKGKLDFIHIMYYEGNKRYAFPFSPSGSFYPSYIDVVTYENGFVTEACMVSRKQIVYRSYYKLSADKVEFSEINYIPSSTFPINGKKNGYFTLEEKLTYTQTYAWAWYMGPETDETNAAISLN